MSAKLEIDVKVRSEQASADVNKLKGDLEEVKSAGSKPVKVRVDTSDAATRVGDVKKALQDLQLGSGAVSSLGAAFGEISQEARSLTQGMTGASKSVADLGIATGLAAANALGPWGQFAAAIVGVIGLIQRLETEQTAQIQQSRQLNQLQGDLGSRYNSLSQNIATTATAQERYNVISQRALEGFRAQISLANQLAQAYSQAAPRTSGLTSAQQADRDAQALTRAAENALPAIQRLRGAQINLSEVLNDQGGLLRNLGISYTQTGNAAVDALNRTAALAEFNRRGIERNIAALRQQAEEAQRLTRFGSIGDFQRRSQEATEARTRLRLAERALAAATEETSRAQAAATTETERVARATRDAAAAQAELEEKNRRAAASASAATSAQLREARNRIFDVASQTQFDERMRVLRSGTDERQRATQQFRSLVAEETYRQQQAMRSVELSRLEEELGRTRRQSGENEAQRQERLAQAQERYNQIRRESLEAQDTEAARRRELSEQEKTQAMETANAVRAAYDLQLQGQQQIIVAQEQLRQARQNLANAGLTQEQIEARAAAAALQGLPAIREQLTIVDQRIAAARERGAAEAEVNRLLVERMGLEAQAASASAESVRVQTRQNASVTNYKNSMEEAANSMNSSLTQAAAAALFAGENIEVALQKALASTLQQVATESAIKALFETAKGFAALATGSPTAGLHFAAAGKFAATAAVAGVAGAAIAPSAPETGPGGSSVSASPRPEAPTRREESEGGQPKAIYISLNAFQSNEQAQALIVRSLREAGYNGRN